MFVVYTAAAKILFDIQKRDHWVEKWGYKNRCPKSNELCCNFST